MMRIPNRNDLLLPFLKLLTDGQVHSQAEIFNALADQFHLTEEQRNERTKGGIPRVENLIAWCKADCTMAKFTEKVGTEGLKITPLGLQEVTQNPHKISVAYVRSFGV